MRPAARRRRNNSGSVVPRLIMWTTHIWKRRVITDKPIILHRPFFFIIAQGFLFSCLYCNLQLSIHFPLRNKDQRPPPPTPPRIPPKSPPTPCVTPPTTDPTPPSRSPCPILSTPSPRPPVMPVTAPPTPRPSPPTRPPTGPPTASPTPPSVPPTVLPCVSHRVSQSPLTTARSSPRAGIEHKSDDGDRDKRNATAVSPCHVEGSKSRKKKSSNLPNLSPRLPPSSPVHPSPHPLLQGHPLSPPPPSYLRPSVRRHQQSGPACLARRR